MLRIPEDLQRFCDGQAEVPFQGKTVCEAVNYVCHKYPELRDRLLDSSGQLHAHFLILHDGQPLSGPTVLESSVGADDTIEIYLIASGG
jgi:hypothetical protein